MNGGTEKLSRCSISICYSPFHAQIEFSVWVCVCELLIDAVVHFHQLYYGHTLAHITVMISIISIILRFSATVGKFSVSQTKCITSESALRTVLHPSHDWRSMLICFFSFFFFPYPDGSCHGHHHLWNIIFRRIIFLNSISCVLLFSYLLALRM